MFLIPLIYICTLHKPCSGKKLRCIFGKHSNKLFLLKKQLPSIIEVTTLWFNADSVKPLNINKKDI
ncbi:MAG: hypothetical protein COA50_06205 [Flavobacteriaceae bacterium]|nr:MAG: hypothetical protein COA50_06205 [Flavobacteriaceae bacterium]